MQYTVDADFLIFPNVALLSRISQHSTNLLLLLDFNWQQSHDHANPALDCPVSFVLRWVLLFQLCVDPKSWRIYECWWLPWFLISKTWIQNGLGGFFGHLFLKNTYHIQFFFVCPAFSTCTYHHRASYFTHGSDVSTTLIFIRLWGHWTSLSGFWRSSLRRNSEESHAVFGPANLGSIHVINHRRVLDHWLALNQPWNDFHILVNVPWIVNFP